MLFDSTLRRDLARTFGATLVVILTIVITIMLIRTLGLAAGDLVGPADVVLVLGYTAIGQLPTMLSLSLFVAIVITLGRMYRDSEMAIWFASGLSLSRFVRPVLQTAWPVLLVVALLLVFVWPWGNRSSKELRMTYQQRSDLSRVTPGVFQSSSDGRRVFFVERDKTDEMNAHNVFVLVMRDAVESVITARTGHIENDSSDRLVVLRDGERSDVDAKTGQTTLASFDTYRMLADEKALDRARDTRPQATSTVELIRQPTPERSGELVWRAGMALGAVNLALLAIGLSHVNPRRPNNWNLVFALLAFVVYFNLVSLSRLWVANGKLDASAALVAIHGGVFLLAMLLLWWRDHSAVWPRKRASRKAQP